MEENPTRKKILLFLKKNGGMTTEDLSGSLRITPMGVRQHLMALKRIGLVRYDSIRHGIGRPNFVYRLTDKAEECFPKSYNGFALDILKGIEESEGRGKVDSLFRWRKERMLAGKKERIEGGRTLWDKVTLFVQSLQESGYMADFSDDGRKAFVIIQYNCPISAVSRNYPEACVHELDMYRELFGPRVERKQCIAQGGLSCEYHIPRQDTGG